MVDLTYWQLLPRQSKLSLMIEYGDEWKSAVFTYWHLVENELVYGQLSFDKEGGDFINTEGQTFKYGCEINDICFVEGEKHLHIFNVSDTKYAKCKVNILSESKTNELPLNFVSIPKNIMKYCVKNGKMFTWAMITWIKVG